MNAARTIALGALLCLSLALSAACDAGQKRSGLPPAAQATIDAVTNDLSRADYEKIYTDAAEEWRRTASADESRANLERIRTSLGNVLSRAQLSASEALAGVADHTLVVSYNTKFERADAIETFTLVERSGRWHLARYAVNSNALR
jgi:hypothetical protein